MKIIKIGFWSLLLSMVMQSAEIGQMGADSTSIFPFANYGKFQNTVITTAPTYVSTKGSCGSSNGTNVSNANQLTNLCSSGSPSILYTNGTVIAWSCSGNYGAPSVASCSANLVQPNGSLTVNISYARPKWCWGVGSGSAPPIGYFTTVVSVPYTVSGNTATFTNGNTIHLNGGVTSYSIQGKNPLVNYPNLNFVDDFDCGGPGG
jgi:hypothetical protein